MKNFRGRCVDKDSIEDYVMHLVQAEGDDGFMYELDVVARDPMHAIEVARFVEQKDWRPIVETN